MKSFNLTISTRLIRGRPHFIGLQQFTDLPKKNSVDISPLVSQYLNRSPIADDDGFDQGPGYCSSLLINHGDSLYKFLEVIHDRQNIGIPSSATRKRTADIKTYSLPRFTTGYRLKWSLFWGLSTLILIAL